jgi:AraC family transcriptional regulator of adaptative response / DNA-3-methyladenine glycosylase II
VIDDEAFLYTVLLARDSRYDGRFFAGVLTTGVFCRPICPAPKPKPGNVRYYPSAAAASDAGFRPCLRCRPEAAPGTPGWLGTEATVRRALREIAAGRLDDDRIDTFAGRMGLGARHLRRLFQQHLGASPRSLAVSRRVLFAKRLLDETPMPVTRIAFAAGFQSIRRFNSAFHKIYQRSPSELRRGGKPKPSDGALELRLATRPPFALEALLSFFAPRAICGVETCDGSTYQRTFRLGPSRGTLAVVAGPDDHSVSLRVITDEPGRLLDLVERVRRLFDLDADPLAIRASLESDRLLAPLLAANPGLRLPGAFDPEELCVRAVLGQQISVAAATTLAARIAQAHGDRLDAALPGLEWLFPTARQLRDADLGAIGMPARRREAIQNVAAALTDGILEEPCENLDAIVARWRRVPGVGEWTAQYIALRAYQEPDAFPAGDLGVRKALSGTDVPCSAAAARDRARPWRPWRGYATFHLWQRLATR